MRKFKNSFPKNPASFETQESDIGMLSIEGDEGGEGGEGGGGSGGEGGGSSGAFSVSESDWQSTQQELQQLRADRDRLGGVEREFGQFRESLKTLGGGQGGGGSQGSELRAPDRNDRSKYPNTSEGAAKFLEDFTDYRLAIHHQKTSATQQASQREQQEAAADTQRTNTLVTEHMKRVSEVSKQVPDFDRVTANGLISFEKHPALTKSILRLKNSAMVEYHLAKNPQEAMQLIRTASVDMDDAKEVLFNLNYKYSEEARKTAARRQAERAGGYAPTETVNGEHAAGGDDAADDDFVRGRFGLGSKK